MKTGAFWRHSARPGRLLEHVDSRPVLERHAVARSNRNMKTDADRNPRHAGVDVLVSRVRLRHVETSRLSALAARPTACPAASAELEMVRCPAAPSITPSNQS